MEVKRFMLEERWFREVVKWVVVKLSVEGFFGRKKVVKLV